MKTAVQFSNQSGDKEFLDVFGGTTTSINCPNIKLFCGKEDAQYEIDCHTQFIDCPPIWKTATVIGVKLIGTWEV